MAKQQYCIRVEPQTMEALNSIAMLENRTRSNLIEFILKNIHLTFCLKNSII